MRERACSCPRRDAAECWRVRYRRELDALRDPELYAERCECACHDEPLEPEPRVVMPSEGDS